VILSLVLWLLAQFAGGTRLSGVNVVTTITIPTSNPTYDAGSSSLLTIGGTAAGDRLFASCTWTNSLGGSGTAVGTKPTWSVTNLPLTIGSNVITVTCTDTAGTSANDVITVTRSAAISTFYVDNASGHNCTDAPASGTLANPFCTFSYGVAHITASSTLYVRAGTYAGDFTITGPSGTSLAHTILSAYPGETAIISGPGINSGRMKISHGCSFMDFVGFTITAHNQGLYIDDDAGTSTACTNITVDGITVHDVGQEGVAIREGSATGPMNVTVKNSLIYNTGRIGTSQNGEGIYTGNSSGTDNTNTVTIFNNIIHDTQDECVELKGDSHDIIVDSNTLYNCLTPGSSFSSTGGAIEIDEPRNSVTNPHQIVRNNIIHDIAATAGITKRGLRMGTGTTAYNNVLYNINSGSTCVLSNTSNYPRVIYQNTVDCTTANAIVTSGTTADTQNNLGPPSSGNNRAITSSDFVSYAGHDYRLLTGSPALNAGANLLATVPTDILGVTRTNPPDLGAYEGAFGGGVSCDVTAASASLANVNTAIAAASSGQTVCVPAGSATWASALNISGKALNLIGNGIGNTVITGGSSSILSMTVGPSNFVRVSGFTFIKGADNSGGNISWDPIGNSASATGVSFRFDHNRIVIASASSTHFLVPTVVYGLIDHNTFDITATSGSIGIFDPFGSGDGNDGGFTPWSRPFALGTDQAVYFEDNTINGTTADAGTEDSIDAYGGARFVIRHNTFTNTTVGFHGLDSGGRRGIVSFEIYSNTFTNNSSTSLRAATIRSGAGVIYSNTYNGSGAAWNGITLMLYRVVQPTQTGGWQLCNGNHWELGSTNFSANESRIAGAVGSPQRVKFLADRETESTTVGVGWLDSASANGYPCRDQPAVGVGQVIEGIYATGNTGGVTIGTYDGGSGIDQSAYLQSGRDYFNGSQRPGYTAYQYPHALSTP
jgi:hypothetical protein